MSFDLTKLLNVSQIYEMVKKGATLEAQEEIMKYREVIIQLSEENFKLRQQLQMLETELQLQKEIKFINGVYYRIYGDQETNDGPFCVRCLDADKKLIRIIDPKGTGRWSCPACMITYRL